MPIGEEDEARMMHAPADHATKYYLLNMFRPIQAGGPMAQHQDNLASGRIIGEWKSDADGNWNEHRAQRQELSGDA